MRQIGTARNQQGAVLLVALIMLLVLTLLGVSGMQGSLMQERMSSAQREGVIALEAAESALDDAENRILSGQLGLGDFHNQGEAPAPFDNETWTVGGQSTLMELGGEHNLQAGFFVEDMGEAEMTDQRESLHVEQQGEVDVTARTARIVAMGRGPSGESRRIVEAFYIYEE